MGIGVSDEPTLLKTSNYIVYLHLPEPDEYYLVHGYTGAVDKVSPQVVSHLLERIDPDHAWHTKDVDIVRQALDGKRFDAPDDDTLDALRKRGYLTRMSTKEERAYVQRLAGFLHRAHVSTRPPSFLIVPVYQCNLRCPYCFEAYTRIDLRKQSLLDRLMTPQTVDSVFDTMRVLYDDRISKRPRANGNGNGKPLKVKRSFTFYGGEPLMGQTRPIVEYIFEKAKQEEYSMSAISNGVELDQFLDLLGPKGISFIQITLDGPRDQHDCKRIGPSYRGTGTYERILANTRLALEKGTSISFRLHNDWTNVARTQEVMDDLASAGLLEFKNFSIYSYPVNNFHRGGREPEYPFMSGHQVCKELDRTLTPNSSSRISKPGSAIGKRLQRYIDAQLPGLSQSMEPCAAMTGMYIFDPLKRIYSCWDTVGIEGKEIGTFSELGPVFNSRADEWIRRSPENIRECQDCKYVFFHFGGCASLPLSTQGTIFSPACYQFQDDFLYAGQAFFAQGPAASRTKPKQQHEENHEQEGLTAGTAQ